MIKKIAFLLTTIFSFVCIEVMAADSVGTIIAVQGQVYATNEAGGAKRLLQRRSEFYLQEFITTQENSMAQLKLRDDTIISLKPSTKYSVSEFNLDTKNPKNNRYVGRLVEGVLISFSGQGENSTHNNHILKTPVESIAIRGTLYESGFKVKKYSSHTNQTPNNNNKTLGIGWVNVEDGAVAVVSSRIRGCDLISRELDNNASFAISSGELNKKGQFEISPRSEVTLTCTSSIMMRKLVAAAIKGNSAEVITTSTGTTEKVMVAPTTPSESTVSNAQQNAGGTAAVINTPQNPLIPPEPLPLPPAPPGRPHGPSPL